MSIPSVAIDILQDHDGVVHHHADAHCNAAQTHHIQRCAKNIHQQEHCQHAKWHGERDGNSSPRPAEEEQNHQCRERDTHHNVLDGVVGHLHDIVAGLIGHHVIHGGVVLLQLLQRIQNAPGNLHFIGTRAFVHRENDTALIPQFSRAVFQGGLQIDCGNFP